MSLVSAIVQPQNLLAAFVAVVSFATIVTLAAPAMQGDKLDARLKSVANRREELRRRSRQQIGKDNGLRRTDAGWIKNFVDRLQLEKLLNDPKVIDRLAQAGYRGTRPVTTFYFFRFALPFVFALLAVIYIFGIAHLAWPPIQKFGVVLVAFGAGFYGPNVYLSNIMTKRQTSIVQAFPDALDLMLICVESGMSIEAALQKVSAEIGGTSIELAEELSLLTAELSYLPERRSAYDGLAKRTNHPGIKGVTTALIQAERYGTPLGGALRTMAKENRELRLAAAEKKAAQLPAKLTVPMIVFFLPVLFLVIIGPAALRVIDTMHHKQVAPVENKKS